jgi:hypothetical protein
MHFLAVQSSLFHAKRLTEHVRACFPERDACAIFRALTGSSNCPALQTPLHAAAGSGSFDFLVFLVSFDSCDLDVLSRPDSSGENFVHKLVAHYSPTADSKVAVTATLKCVVAALKRKVREERPGAGASAAAPAATGAAGRAAGERTKHGDDQEETPQAVPEPGTAESRMQTVQRMLFTDLNKSGNSVFHVCVRQDAVPLVELLLQEESFVQAELWALREFEWKTRKLQRRHLTEEPERAPRPRRPVDEAERRQFPLIAEAHAAGGRSGLRRLDTFDAWADARGSERAVAETTETAADGPKPRVVH